MSVVQAPRQGGGLFGNIGSMLASTVTGPMAPWIMAANAIYNGVKGDWGNALVSGMGAYNGFQPGASPAPSGGSLASATGGGGVGAPAATASLGAAESIPSMWEPYDPNRARWLGGR